MFFALYFCSRVIVGQSVAALSLHNRQVASEEAAFQVGLDAVHKYHAFLAVCAGVVTLVTFSTASLMKPQKDGDS